MLWRPLVRYCIVPVSHDGIPYTADHISCEWTAPNYKWLHTWATKTELKKCYATAGIKSMNATESFFLQTTELFRIPSDTEGPVSTKILRGHRRDSTVDPKFRNRFEIAHVAHRTDIERLVTNSWNRPMAITIAIAAGKTMAETCKTTQKATVRAIQVK